MTTVQSIVASRGIDEILHFTTNKGLLGIIAKDEILSRERLDEDDYLEHVFQPNCSFRKDTAWLDYVNLSITDVNLNLLDVSSGKWHSGKRDVWWCILSLSPSLLAHPGVHFATTNNFYSGVKRGTGPGGLLALFEPRVHQYLQRYAQRGSAHLPKHPTCKQAEVLYPGSLPLSYLEKVYVSEGDHMDQIEGMRAGCANSRPFQITLSPNHFTGRS